MKEKDKVIYLNELRKEAFSHAIAAGFHEKFHSDEHYLCLVVSELMEAVEADRNNRRCVYNIDKIYEAENLTAFKSIFNEQVKDTVEDELADAVIRLLDFAGISGMTIINVGPIPESVELEGEFTDWAFTTVQVVQGIAKRKTTTGEEFALSEAIEWIFFAAKRLNFDLIKHIELKMRYNRMRPRMHGKRY